jgi:hypothetical protein
MLSSWECVLFSSYVPLLFVHVLCNPCFLLENVVFFFFLCSSSIRSCFLQSFLSSWGCVLFSSFVPLLSVLVFCNPTFFLRMCFFFFFYSSSIRSYFLQSLLSYWRCVLFLYPPFEVFCSFCFLLEKICKRS